jgi:hypothetical protein
MCPSFGNDETVSNVTRSKHPKSTNLARIEDLDLMLVLMLQMTSLCNFFLHIYSLGTSDILTMTGN